MSLFDRFQPPNARDVQFQDVPEACCSYCSTYFPQDDPDQNVCDECQRVCRMCGDKYASAFPDQHCCDRCNQLPEEEPTPQPNNPMKDNTFKFTGQPKFEITEEEASAILADPFPNKALDDWLTSHYPCSDNDALLGTYDKQRTDCWELQELRNAFGRHLADKKVAERKQLADIPVEAI